jgi:hypothetical protein
MSLSIGVPLRRGVDQYGVDQYISVFNSYRELRNFDMAVEMVNASAAIVAASMPGADDEIALQYALSDRAAAAGADAIERVDFAIEIAKRVRVAIDEHLGRGARGKRGKSQHADERH